MKASEFDNHHGKQTYRVCILFSYAVAANPFTKRTVTDYMMAYCHEYGRRFKDGAEAEQLVGIYFGPDYQSAQRDGYQHIQWIHDHGQGGVFSEARTKFNLSGTDAKCCEDQLRLKENRTAIVCMSGMLNGNYDAHSVAATFDSDRKQFAIYDPNKCLVGSVARLDDIPSFVGMSGLQVGDIRIFDAVQ